MDIYLPEEDSYLILEAVKQYAAGAVLDMGCGSGILGMAAAGKKEVRSVLSLDLNPDAVKYVAAEIKHRKLKKITVKKSDLFSAVPKTKKFDTIIFNPPYLPRDRHETGGIALANAGGKHGYELSVRFLEEACEHLAADGRILLLISSMTKPQKIYEACEENMLSYRIVGEKALFMERLFVLLIEKDSIRRRLEKKKVSGIKFHSMGKRGKIFIGKYRGIKVAIKVRRESSFAPGTIMKEAYWLRKLEKSGFCPKLYFAEEDFVVMEYLEGSPIVKYLSKASKADARIVLRRLLGILDELDELKLNKEEMHHPHKHVIVKGKKPYLIDFERVHINAHPKNVAQFLLFLGGREVSSLLKKKGFFFDKQAMIELGKARHRERTTLIELFQHIGI